jgi:outer membrane biosynthesis protein TonB
MAGFRVFPVLVLLSVASLSACVEGQTEEAPKVAVVVPPPAPKPAPTPAPATKKPAAPKPAAPKPSTKPVVIDFGGEGGTGGGGW